MNIAIFGGSFDPPHIGHKEIINKSLEKLDIDKLIVVPTFLNPFKTKSYFQASSRFELLKELFKDNHKIFVSDYETKQNKAIQSIDTVKYFKKKYNPKKIFFIIGADNLKSLHLWDNFEELKQLLQFVVISRSGYDVKYDIIKTININLDINISSTKLRENLDLKYIPKKIEKKVINLWNKEFKK